MTVIAPVNFAAASPVRFTLTVSTVPAAPEVGVTLNQFAPSVVDAAAVKVSDPGAGLLIVIVCDGTVLAWAPENVNEVGSGAIKGPLLTAKVTGTTIGLLSADGAVIVIEPLYNPCAREKLEILALMIVDAPAVPLTGVTPNQPASDENVTV